MDEKPKLNLKDERIQPGGMRVLGWKHRIPGRGEIEPKMRRLEIACSLGAAGSSTVIGGEVQRASAERRGGKGPHHRGFVL